MKYVSATAAVVLTLSACGGGDSSSAINNPPIGTVPAPTVTLEASVTSLMLGAAVQLTWSSENAMSCVATGGWSGAQATFGSIAQKPASAGQETYTLTCTGAGGSTNKSISVTVTT